MPHDLNLIYTLYNTIDVRNFEFRGAKTLSKTFK